MTVRCECGEIELPGPSTGQVVDGVAHSDHGCMVGHPFDKFRAILEHDRVVDVDSTRVVNLLDEVRRIEETSGTPIFVVRHRDRDVLTSDSFVPIRPPPIVGSNFDVRPPALPPEMLLGLRGTRQDRRAERAERRRQEKRARKARAHETKGHGR